MTTKPLSDMTPLERRMFFSAARMDTPPIMPAVVKRPAPRARRTSVKHRAIR